jgi:hypothetical protein
VGYQGERKEDTLTYILVTNDRLSNSLSLIVRRTESCECFTRDDTTVDIEGHTRGFEEFLSGPNVVEQACECPGTSTEAIRVFGEQMLRDDLACKRCQPSLMLMEVLVAAPQ